MAPSMPTGLLVLAMLVGQVVGFAKVPKDAAEKGGDVRASRHMAPSPNTCMGRDSSTWNDKWGDGCDWYAEFDKGCSFYEDYGQKEHCPLACNLKCFCPRGEVIIDGVCKGTSAVCGVGTNWRDGRCEPDGSVCGVGTAWNFRDGKCEPDGSACGVGTNWRNGKCEQGSAYCGRSVYCCSRPTRGGGPQNGCGEYQHGCGEWICCTRRGFEPGSRPAARLHALPAPPPAPRPAAGARRGARRATRSREAARVGGGWDGRGAETPALQSPDVRSSKSTRVLPYDRTQATALKP